jgi:multidrug efflux pump
MKLTDVFIKRPVLTVVLNLVLLLVGLLSFQHLSLRSQPKVFRPRISVSYDVKGDDPAFVEQLITTPLESVLKNVKNVTFMQSWSDDQGSTVTLHFRGISQQDFLTAESQVNRAIAQLRLPESVGTARVTVGGRDDQQVMLLAVRAKQHTMAWLADYVQHHLVDRLQQVPGVGGVQAFLPSNALRIQLDPTQMSLHHVSVAQVQTAVAAQSQLVRSAAIVGKQQTLPIVIQRPPGRITNYSNLVVARHNDYDVLLKDVAHVALGHASLEGMYTYLNGLPGGGLNILVADGANPIKVAQHLHQYIHQLQNNMPASMQLKVVYDNGRVLQHTVNEFYWTLLQAIALVVVMTFLFLGNLRFTLIPVVTIPVCMVSGFTVMWFLGFSINLMTLLALILAVGLVVDDAIVVFENSYRHIEQGMPSREAALKSMREVLFPVIGMTLSIAAVYLPTAFLRGKTAVYFQQFSFTLAGMVLLSGWVALTLTPMMCAQIPVAQRASTYQNWIDRFFKCVKQGYQRWLYGAIRYRKVFVLIFIGLLVLGAWSYNRLKTGLEPSEYAGFVIVPMQAPATANTGYLKQHALPLVQRLSSVPEIQDTLSFFSQNNVMNFILLKSQYRSSTETQRVAKKIQALYHHTVALKVIAAPVDINMRSHGQQSNSYSVFLQGYATSDQFKQAAKRYVSALKRTGVFSEVQDNLQAAQPQYQLTVNNQRCRQLGVTPEQVTTAFNTEVAGLTEPQGFSYRRALYPVVLQVGKSRLHDFNVLKDIRLQNDAGKSVALNRLMSWHLGVGLPQVYHQNGIPADEVDITVKPGYTGGQVIKALQQVAHQVLPDTIQLAYSQHFLDTISGHHTLLAVFVLGLVFIYLILAALFESFRDPFIILLTVPLCIVGALVALYCSGGSINLFTSIGLVTLVGLVSKHGVLITHFANQKQKQGVPVIEAVVSAALTRLRPILMTTATMIVGSLPLVFSSGMGSVSRYQIGVVMIAGLTIGTFFSLFVIPVAYTYFAKRRNNKNESLLIE